MSSSHWVRLWVKRNCRLLHASEGGIVFTARARGHEALKGECNNYDTSQVWCVRSTFCQTNAPTAPRLE